MRAPLSEESDEEMAKVFGDVETMKYLSHLCRNGEFDAGDARTRREEDTQRMEEGTGCNFEIMMEKEEEEEEDGAGLVYIGLVGYRRIYVGEGGEGRVGEIGIVIDKAFWGRGLGKEAMEGAMKHGLESVEKGGLGLDVISGSTKEVNIPMIALFASMGMAKVPGQEEKAGDPEAWIEFRTAPNHG